MIYTPSTKSIIYIHPNSFFPCSVCHGGLLRVELPRLRRDVDHALAGDGVDAVVREVNGAANIEVDVFELRLVTRDVRLNLQHEAVGVVGLCPREPVVTGEAREAWGGGL